MKICKRVFAFTALFLVSDVLIVIIASLCQKEFMTQFIAGVADLMGVAMLLIQVNF